MKKLSSILLVDDNEPTNLFHQYTIKKLDCSEHIGIVLDGDEAIAYLQERRAKNLSMPDLILLDINMPRMNGWEFIHAYEADGFDKDAVIIVMLTTSPDPKDKEKATKQDLIDDFVNKPLRVSVMKEILKKHFNYEF